jgi:hypothetical protein
MNQNACKHLGGVVKDYKKFNVDFQHCIYDIEEEDEFISARMECLTSMAYVRMSGFKGGSRKGSIGH